MDQASQLVLGQLKYRNYQRKSKSMVGTGGSPRVASYVRRDANTGLAVVRLPSGSLIEGNFFLDPVRFKAGDPVSVFFSPGSSTPSVHAVPQSNLWGIRTPNGG